MRSHNSGYKNRGFCWLIVMTEYHHQFTPQQLYHYAAFIFRTLQSHCLILCIHWRLRNEVCSYVFRPIRFCKLCSNLIRNLAAYLFSNLLVYYTKSNDVALQSCLQEEDTAWYIAIIGCWWPLAVTYPTSVRVQSNGGHIARVWCICVLLVSDNALG